MARTRVWATEEAGYTDSTAAASIDDKGTDLRVDVRQVVNQLLGVAESTALADPVVTIPTGGTLAALYPLGVEQTYTLAIHWSSFWWRYSTLPAGATVNRLFDNSQLRSNIGVPTTTWDSTSLTIKDPTSSSLAQTNQVQGVYGLVLPVGATIIGVTFQYVRTNAADQIILSLLSNSATTAGASTSIATVTTTGSTTGTMQTATLGTLAATTVADTFYRLDVQVVGGAANTQHLLYGAQVTYTSPSANVRI